MNGFVPLDRSLCPYINSQRYPVAVLRFHVPKSRDVTQHRHLRRAEIQPVSCSPACGRSCRLSLV